MTSFRGLSILLLVFLLIGSAIYLNGSPASLLSDDFVILKAIKEGGPFGMWTDASRAYFRPLVSLLFWVEYQLWQLDPIGYRVTSVLLHSFCALFVVMLGLVVFRTRGRERRSAPYLAVSAGILFLVSVSHSEPVCWASSQTDLLAAFFGLLTLWAYVRGRATGSSGHLAAALLLFICGLLSKESVAALPLLLACYEIFRGGLRVLSWRRTARDLVKVLPFFVAVALYVGVRYVVIGSAAGGYGQATHLRAKALRVLVGLASYPTRTYLPPMPTRIIAISVFGVLLIVILAALYFRWKRGRKPMPDTIPLLVMLYLLSLLPVISLSVSKTVTEGERMAYFPSALGVLLLVAVLDFIIGRLRIVLITVACLALVSGVLLLRADRNWKDAAEITRGIIRSLETLDGGDRLVILNLPDNLRGAHIFRNGFRDMLSLSGLDRKWEEVAVLAGEYLATPADSVLVEESGGLTRVIRSNPEASLTKPYRRLQTYSDLRCCSIVEFAPDAYVFELNTVVVDREADSTLFAYYARAGLRPVHVE